MSGKCEDSRVQSDVVEMLVLIGLKDNPLTIIQNKEKAANSLPLLIEKWRSVACQNCRGLILCRSSDGWIVSAQVKLPFAV